MPTKYFIVMGTFIFLLVIGTTWISYALLRRDLGRGPARRSVAQGMVTIAFTVALLIFLKILLPTTWVLGVSAFIVLALMVWMWFFIFRQTRRRLGAGKPLCVFGPPKVKQMTLMVILSPILVVLNLWSLSYGFDWWKLLIAMIWITNGCLFLAMRVVPAELTEGGVWAYLYLLEWEKVESYTWEGEEKRTLVIRCRNVWFWMSRMSLPIPEEKKARVDEILRDQLEIRSAAT